MMQILENNVSGVLGLALSPSATSMTLYNAAAFPTLEAGEFYLVTLIGLNANGQEDHWEIVRVTAKAANTLTVVRAQEGTVARAWGVGTTVQMRLTKGSVVTPSAHLAALATKVDKEAGKGLSSQDFTLEEKNKLRDIQPGAQVNPTPVDVLTSTDASLPLSANQGRVLKGLIDSINTLLQSDDSSLDELQEIVNFIKLNRADLNTLGIDSIAGLSSALAGKQPLSSVLTNTTASFTTALLTKLNGIAEGAQVNTVTSVAGKTGAVTLDKGDVGLSNVDNTSDADKPVSTATLYVLNTKADSDLSNVTQTTVRNKAGTGTMAYRDVTISTGTPTGGANGDIWYKV